MTESGTEGQAPFSVSKRSLYPNPSDLVLSVPRYRKKLPSENFPGVRRGALEGREEQGVFKGLV